MRVIAIVTLVGCGFSGAPQQNDARVGAFSDAPGTGIDAAVAAKCYGDTTGYWQNWQVCLGGAGTGTPMLTQDIDTDTTASGCLAAQPAGWIAGGQLPACFIVAATITIPAGAAVHAHGVRPLVLVADQTIEVLGTLDVSSHRAGTTGAGIPATCNGFTADPSSNSGGGAGGSFATAGGTGGSSHDGEEKGGKPAPATVLPLILRAGCAGQTGGNNGGTAGSGGGAVYLLAGAGITVSGAIRANGSGGSGGPSQSGGSGGASGGMIALQASTAITAVSLIANGGGGASGGDGNNGNAGQDPAAASVGAPGGNGGGGAGGDGAPGSIDGHSAGDTSNGGGGGGGGLGLIVANKAVPQSVTISPLVTVR